MAGSDSVATLIAVLAAQGAAWHMGAREAVDTQINDRLSQFWDFGAYEFAGIGLLIGVLTLVASYIFLKRDREMTELKQGLAEMHDQRAKINNTLIVTSELAISNLPQITYTQQIPSDVMDTVSIIDETFDAKAGEELWETIYDQPRAARLAYARAIYKFGLNPLNKDNLGTRENPGLRGSKKTSVIQLLDAAMHGAIGRNRAPVTLQRDILVRKCQVLRQGGEFQKSIDVSMEIGELERGDSAVQFLEPWCLALAHLQWATTKRNLAERNEQFARAVDAIYPCFDRLFGARYGGPPHPASSTLPYYRRQWPNVEPRSIAYYTAKALWCFQFTSADAANDESAEWKRRLHRAIDLSLLFYEESLTTGLLDTMVRCSYNVCIAYLIAVRRELLPQDGPLIEFGEAFANLATKDALDSHALECLNHCEDLLRGLRIGERRAGPQYIYTERTEKIDTLDNFESDVQLLRTAFPGQKHHSARALRDFYQMRSAARV